MMTAQGLSIFRTQLRDGFLKKFKTLYVVFFSVIMYIMSRLRAILITLYRKKKYIM
jgi:hypothetical protein